MTGKLAIAARRVVENAYGTSPRHTRARSGGCRDDCIPCGIEALRAALEEEPEALRDGARDRITKTNEARRDERERCAQLAEQEADAITDDRALSWFHDTVLRQFAALLRKEGTRDAT